MYWGVFTLALLPSNKQQYKPERIFANFDTPNVDKTDRRKSWDQDGITKKLLLDMKYLYT